MDINLLALIAGGLLSLCFSYIPGLQPWFSALTAEAKSAIMAGLLLLVSAVIFALQCGGLLEALLPGLGVTCNQSGVLLLVRIFIMALVANQGVYKLSPQLKTEVKNG
jgi:hypothetical protein